MKQTKRQSRKEMLLEKLQELSEFQLTNNVLLEVFKALGYDRVYYTGGPSEEGKDIVCWGVDELGDTELATVQVKRYKPSRTASDKRSFSGLVTQMSQSLEKPLPHVDGKNYLPAVAYLVTPYCIDTLALKSRFEGFQSIGPHRLKIIDGERLIGILKKYLPHLVATILGSRPMIRQAISTQLTNETLLRALETPQKKSVETFYTDIDLFLGSRINATLLTSPLGHHNKSLDLTADQWETFSESVRDIELRLGCSILLAPRREVDEAFEKISRQYQDWHRLRQRLADERLKLKQELDSKSGEFVRVRERSSPTFKMLNHRRSDLMERIAKREYGRATLLDLQMDLEETEKKIYQESPLLFADLQEIEALRKQLQVAIAKSEDHNKRRPPQEVKIRIGGADLAQEINSKRSSLRRELDLINSSDKPSPENLRALLVQSKEFVDLSEEILANEHVYSVLSPLSSTAKISAGYRLRVPSYRVLETGINITLLGDAGAGKTTSLQMYACQQIDCSGKRQLVVYAPLSRVLEDHLKRKRSTTPITPAVTLVEGLARYLSHLGADIESSELQAELKDLGGILLLDGVDEVIEACPWILSALQSLSDRFPKAQIVTSSRVSGDYLTRIPFLSLTLLPFTDSQREVFVNRWFDGSPQKAEEVLLHLESTDEVKEVVSSPLLATILCVLAEKGVPLPDSELRLYEERMRLLLGHYDLHKQVSRLTTHSRELRKLAQRLAFQLHAAGLRHEKRDKLYGASQRILGSILPEDECYVALDELIDPCCILMPMIEDGKWGFGHLQYQEYLTARELAENRAISILPFLQRNWWRGALVFFAKMNDSLDWLIEEASEAGILGDTAESLLTMIEVYPEDQRSGLEDIIRLNLESEEDEFNFLDINSY